MNNWYLCYNPTKGFYCSGVYSDDVLCCSHDKKGFKTQKAKVERRGIEILVSSNFGYGGNSYLCAQIQLNGRYLFNFEDIDMLHALNGFDPLCFFVRPVETEWYSLFNRVANICNNSLLTRTDIIENYFSELSRMVEASKIELFDYLKGYTTFWDKPLLIILLTSRQITGIIKAMDLTVYDYEFINNLLLGVCKQFLRRFNSEYNVMDLDDKRVKQIADNLYYIHGYMRQNDCAVDFIKSIM